MIEQGNNSHLQEELPPPEQQPQAMSQYEQARMALQTIQIGNSETSHKNQLLRFVLKFKRKTLEDESIAFNKAAEEGNFAKVIALLASQRTEEGRNYILNEARPRGIETETDVSISNNHKHKGWYDLTPLALAAVNGHTNVVEYLLRQGADPTFRGSPSQDRDFNALEAAKHGVKAAQQDINSVLSFGKDEYHQQQQHETQPYITTGADANPTVTALDYAQSLVEKRDRCLLCLAMLETAEKDWPLAQGYSSHYRKRFYNSKPKDIKALRTLLDAISLENTGTATATLNESLVQRLASKIAKGKNPKEAETIEFNNGSTLDSVTSNITKEVNYKIINPKIPQMSKKNRGRRHSDSFCTTAPSHRPVLIRAPSFLQDKTFPSIQFV
jgi:hypothetical protein